jgi:hypothetical protein
MRGAVTAIGGEPPAFPRKRLVHAFTKPKRDICGQGHVGRGVVRAAVDETGRIVLEDGGDDDPNLINLVDYLAPRGVACRCSTKLTIWEMECPF